MAHPVDIHVGKKILQRRWLAGMAQQQLGAKVGIKFHEIQKCEIGANRVSASCLWDIAASLDVQISYFFERIDDETVASGNGAVPSDLMGDKEALDLVRCYYAVPENQRRKLFELARAPGEVA